jgi:hypothetical protein
MRISLILCFSIALSGCTKDRAGARDKTSSVSATLSLGGGPSQTLTAMFEDPDGGSRIAEVTLSVMSNNVRPGAKSKWSASECLVRYDTADNAVWLVPDIGGTWGSHPIIAGSSTTFSNSQCTVVASGSSARVSGNTVTVDVELKFTSAFAGEKQLYTSSKDVNGDWSTTRQHVGSFVAVAVKTP